MAIARPTTTRLVTEAKIRKASILVYSDVEKHSLIDLYDFPAEKIITARELASRDFMAAKEPVFVLDLERILGAWFAAKGLELEDLEL